MPGLGDAIERAVHRAGGNGLSLNELEVLVTRTDQSLATAPHRRATIASTLTALEESGAVRLPASQRQWDASGTPPLPLWVRPPWGSRAKPPSRRVPVPADLRPELAAARSLGTLSPDELVALRQANAWLARRVAQSTLVISHRERSLEVFGHEKRLDALVSSRLFTSGTLSFEVLSCAWTPPLLAFKRVSGAPTALVVENAATFRSLATVLAQRPGPVGVVVYGAGNAFAKTVSGLLDEDIGTLDAVWYFGDLDEEGLLIPRRASAEAVGAGLPALLPALGLYRLLLDHGHGETTPVTEPSRARVAASWLGPLADEAERLLRDGFRFAQEAVGLELLTDEWIGSVDPGSR
ncbi:MAG: Wadjet anti-phage system protein JetD domain-containing protein [Acidimicrobiales bacterium]